ncbi:hypothetical protein KUH03_15170 [Sphingobacterium sp. E70]|uniref:hypothetical protein n=1 Tax=Sphingobacterium sp. E70 TaxID=2853439 RepID=UPI00211C2AD6|nr:hypothetical protein [Sphingobacterium sp. E70]ULT27853.1 hypothetical protein KUH03_15170 [Sphingobacterium sp. E70]
MKKNSIVLIIGLMSLALIGVLAMQFYFLRDSYRQKSQLFDESVNAALTAVAGKLERREVVDFAKVQQERNIEKSKQEQAKQQQLTEQLQLQTQIENLRGKLEQIYQKYKLEEDRLKATYPNIINIENWFYETYVKRTQYQDLVEINIVKTPTNGLYYQEDVIVSATKTIPRIEAKDDSTRFLIVHIDDFKRLLGKSIVALPQDLIQNYLNEFLS